MLIKSIKHEFYGVLRQVLPWTVFLAAMSVALNAIVAFTIAEGNAHGLVGWQKTIAVVATLVYLLALVGFCCSSIATVVYRFTKSMTTEEAYLTHTLPIKTTSLILAKLFVASVLHFFTFFIVLISCVGTASHISLRLDGKDNDYRMFLLDAYPMKVDHFVIYAEYLLTLFFFFAFLTLLCYVSIAIGQLFASQRILISIFTFGALSLVLVVLIPTLLVVVLSALPIEATDEFVTIHVSSWGFTILFALFGILFFHVTSHVFQKRLNLE